MAELSESTANAIVKLLEDPAEDVCALMEAQLKTYSLADLLKLRDLIDGSRFEARRKLDGLISTKKSNQALMDFRKILDGKDFSLQTLVSYLAVFINPDLKTEEVNEEIKVLVSKCRNYLRENKGQDKFNSFRKFMAEKCVFEGERDDYYAVENSSIYKAIKCRKGLPITLTVLYIIVGRQVKLDISGIGLPGHFIGARKVNDKNIYFDPFSRGRLLSRQNCIDIVERAGVSFKDYMLDPLPSEAIFFRMLNNLRFAFHKNKDAEKEKAVREMVKAWSKKFL